MELYQAPSEQSLLDFEVLETEKVGERKDLRGYNKRQILVAALQGQSPKQRGGCALEGLMNWFMCIQGC